MIDSAKLFLVLISHYFEKTHFEEAMKLTVPRNTVLKSETIKGCVKPTRSAPLADKAAIAAEPI